VTLQIPLILGTDGRERRLQSGDALIAAAIWGSGATVPASPVAGQTFLHTPTGRQVLLCYNGSAWQPVGTYGNITMYVDTANGADTINQGGTTTSGAFKSVSYALSWVKTQNTGSIVINVAAGTYAENVVISGVLLSGGNTLTITAGTFTTLDSSLATSFTTNGSGATQISFTRSSGTWTANQRQDKPLKFLSGANAGEYLLIDSNTTTIATLVGSSGTTIANGDTFTTLDWAVIIAPASGVPLTISETQQGVILNNILFQPASGNIGVSASSMVNVTLNQCKITSNANNGLYLALGSTVTLNTSYISGTTTSTVSANSFSTLICSGTKIDGPTNSVYNVCVIMGAVSFAQFGSTVLNGSGSSNNAYGIYCVSHCTVFFNTSGVYGQIRGFGAYGVSLNTGSLSQNTTSNNVFSGNTNNTQADAYGSYVA
jgi:hypothetical protein